MKGAVPRARPRPVPPIEEPEPPLMPRLQPEVPVREDYYLMQQMNWQSGVYFLRVQAGKQVQMVKIVKQ